MPLDESVVGRTYPATAPYQVGREKIREFADAIGDPNPAYRGEAAIAPPTFAFVVGIRALEQLIADPDLGIALERLIHADQRFTAVRPIRAGDEIVATATIAAVRKVGPMDMITLETALATVDGEQLGTSTSVLAHAAGDAA
jgi:acyl dehydratase